MVPHAGGVPNAADRPVALIATIASPWGPLHVAVSDRGVAAVSWLSTLDSVVADLARRLGGEAVSPDRADPRDPRRPVLDEAVAALERWLDGAPEPFDLPLDLTGLSAWDQAVLGGVRRIPWGRTESYGGVARLIGRAGAARAVGGAVSRNPVGIIVPCHRVIAGDGGLGGYGGDAWGSRETRQDLKRALLRLEGVTLASPSD
jgi:methylated-DNA-[protein]-cysteine S-methyltransferase